MGAKEATPTEFNRFADQGLACNQGYVYTAIQGVIAVQIDKTTKNRYILTLLACSEACATPSTLPILSVLAWVKIIQVWCAAITP